MRALRSSVLRSDADVPSCRLHAQEFEHPSGAPRFGHAFRAVSKRTKPYTWAAVSATDNYSMVGYPGKLDNCEGCHVADTYNYKVQGTSNLLDSTVGTGKYNAATDTTKALSPYVAADNVVNCGTGFSYTVATSVTAAAAGTTLVNSPMAGTCFACHDDDLAVSHMKSKGGSIYAARSTAPETAEQCTLCHTEGKVADIKVMHAK